MQHPSAVLGAIIVHAIALSKGRPPHHVLGEVILHIHDTVLVVDVIGGHQLLGELAALAAGKAGVISLNVKVDREESAKVLEVFASRMLVDVAGKLRNGGKYRNISKFQSSTKQSVRVRS